MRDWQEVIDPNARIVPAKGLGGLTLRVHVSEISDLVGTLGIAVPGSYRLNKPFQAEYSWAMGRSLRRYLFTMERYSDSPQVRATRERYSTIYSLV